MNVPSGNRGPAFFISMHHWGQATGVFLPGAGRADATVARVPADSMLGRHTFTKHLINGMIPVPSLVMCKMQQDNLDLLVWTRKFWDQYDPVGD